MSSSSTPPAIATAPPVPAPPTYYAASAADIQALRLLIRRLRDTPRQSAAAAAARRELRANGAGRPSPTGHGERLAGRDLGASVALVSEAVDLWFSEGRFVPAAYPHRVQRILRATGRLDWEKAFLAVFCHHFGESLAWLYEELVDRADELKVHSLPLRLARKPGGAVTAATEIPRDQPTAS